ncbi:uncharacterized protein HMPREF1541_08847 [Cyphellophora europaea CBS 101466]|uniref:Uncharacterized protein n=1 Tax=Cyphellophora europaea (strain CBS 101466) TaxID=1220924 RepID=W2RLG2_CYPE1|nr:uncharacterized protein HMPREF1541_08847 [Cyphellophora europaea CBS 101466]ETN36569.1 hypothetical protein HMPREF1541_08847 [Cyphellophora europaea CBS 101466]
MGGSNAPFLYDRPQSWNFGAPTSRGFNPKAATEASWTPRANKPKSNGPLVDFNKHPDSYLVVPYGNLTTQPMHPNTKKRVVRARTGLLVLRWLALLGAMGLLFCVISINKTTTTVAWIIRCAPAVALCQLFYAVYHLGRSVTSRTPGSSASYMVFSGLIDLGLIPFFAFSAYMSYLDHAHNMYEWSTLFNDTEVSYKIIFAFFILSTTECGLLALCLLFDVYLAVTFRKIAKMPPDMNPLEDNLTSRFGHKRNKSSMNITEKHMSASTLVTNRDSGMGKRVPFIHTRTDSADSVTLYGNEYARNSRVEMRKGFEEVTKDPYRVSTASVPGSPLRPGSAHSPAPNTRAAGAGLDHRPARSSIFNASPQRSPNRSPARPSSWLSYIDYEGMPTDLSDTANQQLDEQVRPISPVSTSPSHGPLGHSWSNRPSTDVNRFSDANGDMPHVAALMAPTLHATPKRSREPLGMHPPSPAGPEYDLNDENYYTAQQGTHDPMSSPVRPILSSTNGNSRPSSFIGSGTKSRFYGDLRASINGRGVDQTKDADANVVEIYPDSDDDRLADNGNGIDRSRTMKSMQSASDYSGNIEVYESDSEGERPPRPAYRYSQKSPYKTRSSLQTPSNNDHYSPTPPPPMSPSKTQSQGLPTQFNSPRQTSNSTGLDLHSGYAGLGPEFGRGMARRRDVSGKVAEEGRGGNYQTEIMDGQAAIVEETTPQKTFQSAGWARFKGL